MDKILITGTPGVGKSEICRGVSRELGIPCIEVNRLVSPSRLRYVPELDTYDVVDWEGALEDVARGLPERYVAATHAPQLLSRARPDAVFVIRRRPDLLYEVLRSRGWPMSKVAENVLAEYLDVVLGAAAELGSPVYQIDASDKTVEDVVSIVVSCARLGECVNEEVDWIGTLEELGLTDWIMELEKFRGV